MAIKAVYASGTLAIYITREDLDQLLTGIPLHTPLYAQKQLAMRDCLSVHLTPAGAVKIRLYRDAEREAIREGQLAWNRGVLRRTKKGGG